MITTDNETINKINWSAVLHAMIFFLCPRNCPATTAPPVANAENNHGMNTDKLYVKEVHVGPGPIMKRVMPRAQGRAFRILKRTSHVTLVLGEKE